jgi:3',5'-cyclic AMP phosphodiesterase CpdA
MKLAFLADLHFGSVPPGLADQLRETIELEKPDLAVIAGDLTLRARRSEFEAAQKWLASLSTPALILPGNHDLPYWNLLQRFADPFHRFHKAANTETLMPVAEMAGGFVLGFNTTRSWQPHLRWQEGVARRRDILAARQILAAVPSSCFKAVAAHHPLISIAGMPRVRPVRMAGMAIEAFGEAGADLVMTGHTHRSFAVEIEAGERSLIAVGAPTALSKRMRGEANGFWIIDAEAGAIRCTLFLWTNAGFAPVDERIFLARQRGHCSKCEV